MSEGIQERIRLRPKVVKRKLTEAMLSHIQEEAEKISYGRIIIDLNEHIHAVDITVEVKTRFEKN